MQKNGRWSRREFLSRGAAGAVTGAWLAGAVLSEHPEPAPIPSAREMLVRTLGTTGIKVPIVSMGVMNAEVPDLVMRAYEKGIRLLDTSAYYQRGRNEEMIGTVLKQLNARKDVVIQTKVYLPHGRRSLPPEQAKAFYLKTAEESLKRLRTDYVDILLSHSVDDVGWLNNPGVLEALRLLKKQGKARFIGFSTHQNMVECIRDATRSAAYDVILTMFNYTLWDDLDLTAALQAAQAKGIGLVAMKTQCPQYGGHWDSLPAAKLPYYRGRIMHPAVLKWVLRHPFITTAIPGFTTFEQIEDDLSVAYDLEYTDEERKFLEARKVTLAFGYCRQCAGCVAQCARRVDIPTLMRVHMYSRCYGNLTHARQTLEDIEVGRTLRECAACRQCSVQCRSGIDVARRLGELLEIFG
jgi:predicted aldo/keto reductase-like oxidoreductase